VSAPAQTAPTLVAVAHGTRHPGGPPAVERLVDAVRRQLPDVEVVSSYVELVDPRVHEVLARLRGPAVVVPLLLSTGHHVRTDLPAAAAHASAPARLTRPLGPSRLLTGALTDRLHEAGAAPGDPVVLAAAGTSDPAGVDAVRQAARLLQASWPGRVTHGFVSTASPDLTTTMRRAARGLGRPVTIAPYLMAPGRFARDIERAAEGVGRVRCARVLGDHPAVARLVAARYREHVRR
jgi:sirohydrochlorin ferrochelatase